MIGYRERGAVAPFVAIMLVLIVICVALVVDLGHIHNVKVQLQRAVDAAALAAAQQLDGSTDARQRAIDAAVAVAYSNQVDGQPLVLTVPTKKEVLIGNWNKEGFGQNAASRLIIPGGIRPDAAMVRVSRNVDHVFFFLSASTQVVADAIAVNSFEELMFPLAIVSCLPSSGPPDGKLNVCGISTYEFASESRSSAGWTSLTFGNQGEPSEQDIIEFLKPGGSELFKRIIKSLDNAAVAQGPLPYSPFHKGCEGNVEESISCGLGGAFRGYKDRVGDPLLRYSELPRFIGKDSEERQAFLDIVYQNDILDPRKFASPWAYNEYLEHLYHHSPGNDFWLRFKPFHGEDNFITYNKKTGTYTPNFRKILDYAGYPPVNTTAGFMTSAMKTVLGLLTNKPHVGKEKSASFKDSLTDFHPPFDVGGRIVSHGFGKTVLLTIPVIFAGSCEDLDDDGRSLLDPEEETEMLYVGMAHLLVTRAWKDKVTYNSKDPVQVWGSFPSECNASDFDPQLVNGDLFAGPVPGPSISSSGAFEGLLKSLGREDEKRAGIRKIVLVE